MKKLLLLILVFTSLTGFSRGNTHHISGTGYKKNDEASLPGVTVNVKGTNVSTVTGLNGTYTINVPDGKTGLSVIYAGYKTQTIKIGKNNKLDVYLEADTKDEKGLVRANNF